MKGLGGYHLVCDAGNDAAVADLRRRKHRDEKPFAVMVRGPSRAAELFCVVDDAERRLLALRAGRSCCSASARIAPSPMRSLRAILSSASCCHIRRCIICCCERSAMFRSS